MGERWPEILTIISGPFFPLVALATDAFGLRTALIGALEGLWTWIQETFETFAAWFEERWTTISTAVMEVLEPFIEFITELFTTVTTFILEIWEIVFTWFQEKWEALSTGVTEILTTLQETIQGVFESVTTWIQETWGAVFTWFTEKWEALRDKVGEIAGNIRDSIVGFFQEMIDKVTGFFSELGKLPGKVREAVADVPVIGGIASGIGGILGFAQGGIVPGPVGAPMLAMVHGGERVLRSSQPGGGVMNVTVNVAGSVIAERDLVSRIRDGLRRETLLNNSVLDISVVQA